MPIDEVDARVEGGARFRRSGRVHRPDAVGTVRRPAPPRRDRAGDGVQAARFCSTTRRRPASIRSPRHGRRRDHQAARSRGRQLDRRHAPAARRVLRRDAHGRARRRRARSRSCAATPEKEREAEFIMLRDGLIVFEGDAERAAQVDRSRICRRFCREGLIYAANTIARLVGTENRRADDRRDRHRRVTIFLLTGGSGFFWQRYSLKTRFSNVAGLKPGSPVRVAGVEVGIGRPRSIWSASRSTSTFEVNKKLSRADHDRVGREARVGVAARRERGGHHAAAASGTPIPDGATCRREGRRRSCPT